MHSPSLQTPALISPDFFPRTKIHNSADRQLCTVSWTHSPSYLKYSNTVSTCFQRHRYPTGHVWDQGPLFTLKVCKAFMEKLGVSVSLISGYNLCTNREKKLVNSFILSVMITWRNAHVAFPGLNMHKTSCTTQLKTIQWVLDYQPPLFPGMPHPKIHQLLLVKSEGVAHESSISMAWTDTIMLLYL